MSLKDKPFFSSLKKIIFGNKFKNSYDYWERRYVQGGTSGPGSYGMLADFKAEIINDFVKEKNISCVIEWGCGDGNQLSLIVYPMYLGFDISESAVLLCRNRFSNDSSKHFELVSNYRGETADLVISLDVIFHLVEEKSFIEYMERLFDSSEHYVIIYSSNTENNFGNNVAHVRHRCFTNWIEKNRPNWFLEKQIPNKYEYSGDILKTSFSEFFIYRKRI